MKKLFLIIGLSVVSIFAQAEDNTCSDISELAEAIMTSRQYGMSAIKLVKIAEESFGEHDALAIEMIDAAFDEPRYTTEDFKQEAIEEFTSMYFLECYKIMRED